ncbi:hypothetical protein [Natronomonas sp. EA1]|uniref:hypothetical protein n=1 Tax=Natronomonas sp. EA1 TaxID=3421655 RepID=UPI003EB6EC82
MDDDLLYAGETKLLEATVGDTRLVATSHRLLVFGAAYRPIERPNVGGVRTRTVSETESLSWGGQALVLGVASLAGGVLAPVDGVVGATSIENTAGVPGLGAIQSILSAIALLDEALLLLGVLGVLVGLFGVAMWLASRERVVEIEVAGGDPVQLSGDATAVRDLLTAWEKA